jgi:hypothetical protein
MQGHGVVEPYYRGGYRVVTNEMLYSNQEYIEVKEHLYNVSRSFNVFKSDEGLSLSVDFEGVTKQEIMVITDTIQERLGPWLEKP